MGIGKHSHESINIRPYTEREKTTGFKRKNIFACLFSVHHTISSSRHEQVLINSRDKRIVSAKTGFKIFKENKKIYYCFVKFCYQFLAFAKTSPHEISRSF